MKQMIGSALCRNSPLAGSLFYPLLVCHNPIWWHQGWPVICFHFRRFDFTEAPFQDTKRCFRVCRHVPKRESCSQAESSSSWVPWTEKLRLKKKGESVAKPCKTIIKPKEFHRFQFSVCFQWLYVPIFMYELEVFSSALKQNLGEDPKSGNNGSTNFWWPSQTIHPSWR